MFGRKKADKVMKGPKVKAAVHAKATAAQEYWKDIAPVFGDKPPHRAAPSHGAPGAYRDSITTVDMSSSEGAHVRIQTSDFKARWIEYGNSHMPTYAPKSKVLAKFRK
jgi:hypothetical protein